jgi:DNA-binding GntR family transcriptional regulator
MGVGTHLKAGEIAEELDVSRTSVRKAIIRLVDDGIVTLNAAGRPIVAALPKKSRKQPEPIFAYTNQTEQAYWAVFEEIFTGKLREGESVNGQELAATIGVSLGTVRQALDWLCRDGLLQREPRRGWKVVSLNADDLVDAFKIRLLLEPEAITRSARRMKHERLEALIAENQKVLDDGDRMTEDDRRRTDYHFHRALLEDCGSTILSQTVDPVVRKCMLTGIALPVPASEVTITFNEHIEIAKALIAGDPERAKQVLSEHLTRSMRLYEQLRATKNESNGEKFEA